MTVNRFFNQTTFVSEQNLLDKLTVESIQIYGNDLMYIPRNLNNFDQIYETDDQSSYTTPITIEMLIESVQGFNNAPNDNIMTVIGLRSKSQITLAVSISRFTQEITTPYNISRPREGDLIYYPVHKKLFQIKYVDPRELFYELGSLHSYRMTCELFEYSNEIFNTGIPDIDIIQTRYNTNELDFALIAENNAMITDENNNVLIYSEFDIMKADPIADNEELLDEVKPILVFDEENPFGDIF